MNTHRQSAEGDPKAGIALRAAGVRQRLPRVFWNAGQVLANRLAYRPLVRACQEHRPDLIHESYLPFSTTGVRAARRTRIPLLLGVHELSRNIADTISPVLRGYARRVDRATVLGSDGVMCITSVLRGQILDWGYPADRLLVLHNAVDLELFERAAASRDEVRRRLEVEDSVVIGYLQAWNAVERFDAVARMLEESVDRILLQLPHAVFLLVGGGVMLERLRGRLVAEPSRRRALRLVGQVAHQEVPQYLGAMDIAICAEHSDFTSPMKLFEYMASALPMVAPEQPNIGEILEDGRTALFFRPGDSAGLADRIVKLARSPDLARRLGLEAKRTVVARHTWDAYGRTLSDFSQHICSLPPRSHSPLH